MKKVLSLLLAVMMAISLCPITALADEVNPIELQQVEAQEEQQEVAEPLAETAGEAVERTLSAGDFRINYKAAADGTVTEAGSNTYNAGTGKVYDVVLPYGAEVTSVTVADGSSYAQKLVYTAASSSAVTINDENVSAEDKYFKEAELLLADAVSSLVSSITWNESAFATDNMKGFVLEGRSFYPVKGSTIAFVRMPRTEQSGEQPEDPNAGGYYTESGAVIAFDENGISGCNYTVDETVHELYIKGEGIYRNVSITKTYIIRMHAADFSLKNNGSAKVILQTANAYNGSIDYLESGEQKSAADLSAIKQTELDKLTQAKYNFTNTSEVYYTYIDSVGEGKLNAAILIEIIPDSMRVDGNEFAAEKTELTGWNRIKSDGSTERVECSNIYMMTLPYGDESISLDLNGAAKYAGQALGSERTEFGDVKFAGLFANSDYAVTGDKKAEGVSVSALFGDNLPGTLSDRDKVVFIAAYDAEGNAKAGVIARVYVPDTSVSEIATAADLVAFRDYVNAGNTAKNAKLVADIDLSTVCGEEIGSFAPIEKYEGTFDGNNHTISNLYLSDETRVIALFSNIAENGTVKNLGIVSSTIKRSAACTRGAALLCYQNSGCIENCFVKNSNVSAYAKLVAKNAIFCACNYKTIKNCYIIDSTISDQGGTKWLRSFVGVNSSNDVIENCYAANITITTTASLTETFAASAADEKIKNCYVLDTDNQTTVNATAKTAEWFKSDEAIAALGEAWEKDTDNKNGGFPVLKAQSSGGESGGGENTPPVRRSNVAASVSMGTDDNLKCEIDLSKVFYDADGDALTYKVRVGEEGEYVPFEGSVYTYTAENWESSATLYFTANDGKTDGGSYIVKVSVPRTYFFSLIDKVVADPSDYWTENDEWNGEKGMAGGFYKWFLNRYNYYKSSGNSDYWYSQLADAFRNLIPKSRVNATDLYYAVNSGKAAMKEIDIYTEMSKIGFEDAYNAAMALFADGAIAYEPYSEAKQAEIESVAAALKERVNALVKSDAYKKAFENYQSRKEEAKKLLELYNPEKYTESDYTAESWQAFVAAWNDLKADVDFVFDETSGTTREYEMLKNFEKHMEALPTAFGNLVSAVDVTVSFKYIDNMQFRYGVAQQGTNAYMNSELKLAAGSTTVEGAFTAAGITNFTFFSSERPQIMEGKVSYSDDCLTKPVYALFVNGVYVTTGKLDALKTRQLHNGDKVVLARITSQFSGSEYSSGYDSTTWEYSADYRPNGIEDSVGNIAITGVTQNAKVGDTVTIRARAKKAFSTTLGGSLDVSGLTLLVSAPAEENVISQNWVTTPITGDENGKIDYVFAEPGYYTIAVVNNKYDIPATHNVYGIDAAGTYNTLMIGDFTTVYIAPADDTDALIAEWRAKNLAEAKEYFEQFHDYDFKDGFYKRDVLPAYEKLVENQNSAKTFKEVVDNYNNDFVNLKNKVEKNLRDHDALVAELRKNLGYLPEDLSDIDYTYAPVVRTIQNIYNTSMNYYERTLLTQAEIEIVEKILLINVNDLVRPALTTIDVQKDDNVRIQSSPGWLASAPNENRVTQLMANGSTVTGYYKWTTGTGAEPDDTGMGAVAGERVSARRLVVTSDEEYWMAFSIDGGNTWKLADKVAGGEGMFNAVFIMPETEGTLVFSLKMVSKTVYDEMKASAEAPNMDLDNAKASYKAALEEVFASYDKDRYSVENYTSLRYAKENGIANIDSAKSVTAVVKQFNAAIEAMKAVPQKAQVYVEVKNETFTESYVDDSGNTITPPWTGTLVAKWVDIDKDSSMMSSIVKALEGHEVLGAENNYISSIDGLGEFGGGSGSGWMGTLNDWFTNYGFAEFTVANGTLKAGDRISVMYTCTLGSDIGGAVEGNTDTSLKALSATNGTLAPAFDKETTSYLLTMDEGKHTVTLDYTASNKAFQVRTYLNGYDPAAAKYYSVGEAISVKEGDVIYVACGDPAWPSMAGNDALKIIPHVYEITVVGSSGAVEKLIKALPAPEKLEYSDKADVDNAKLLFDALTEEQKAAISEELQDKLAKCVARMAELEKVHAVEELIEALPAKRPLTEEQETKLNEAREAFDALGDLQKDVKQSYINKLLALVGRQAIYFDYQGGKANTKMLYTQNDGKLAVLPETTNGDLHFGGWYTERYGGTKITLDTIFTDTCMLYAHWLNDVEYAEKLIDSIGEVTLESEEAIAAARAAYNALPIEQQELVGNYEVLTAAEAEYARLVKEAEDKAAAKAVDDLIAAIGEVKLTEECDAKIKAARKAFNALTPEQKAFVKNEKALTDAEAEYQKLFDQHKADEAAAKVVDEAVAKLAPVTLESGNAVKAARKAFDELTPAQRELLKPETENNLKAAEAEYARLVKEAEDKAAAKAVDEAVAKLAPVTLNSGKAIEAARKAFDALTPEQKKFLASDTESKLVAAENEYKKLVKEDADKKAAKEVEDKIAALQPVTKDSGDAIKAARDAYNALTEEQKALVSKDSVAALDKAEKVYDMIIASTKPGTAVGDNTGSTSGSGVIHIAANGASKGERNPNTGAPAMSIAPAMLVLAAAALVLKKRG